MNFSTENLIDLSETLTDYNARKEYLLIQIGSTWLLDSLHIYLVTFLGTVGLFLNAISYMTFSRIKFHKRILKSFMKAYTFNTSVCCLIAIFNFTARSPRFVESITFSFIGGFFRCKSTQIVGALYFFSNVLDCLILLERLSNFVPKIANIFSNYFKPSRVIFVSFICCVAISSPFLYDYDIRSSSEFYDSINNINKIIQSKEPFTFCGRNPFFKTKFGIIISGLVTIIRDLITLIIEIVLSILSIILFRRYLITKKKYFTNFNQINPNFINDNNSIQNQNVDTTMNFEESNGQPSRQLNTLFKKTEKFNTNLTKMTIYLTFCSILLHLVAAIITIFLILNDNSFTAHIFLLIIIGAYHLKFISNFFFFYRFNNNFKLCIHSFFVK